MLDDQLFNQRPVQTHNLSALIQDQQETEAVFRFMCHVIVVSRCDVLNMGLDDSRNSSASLSSSFSARFLHSDSYLKPITPAKFFPLVVL